MKNILLLDSTLPPQIYKLNDNHFSMHNSYTIIIDNNFTNLNKMLAKDESTIYLPQIDNHKSFHCCHIIITNISEIINRLQSSSTNQLINYINLLNKTNIHINITFVSIDDIISAKDRILRFIMKYPQLFSAMNYYNLATLNNGTIEKLTDNIQNNNLLLIISKINDNNINEIELNLCSTNNTKIILLFIYKDAKSYATTTTLTLKTLNQELHSTINAHKILTLIPKDTCNITTSTTSIIINGKKTIKANKYNTIINKNNESTNNNNTNNIHPSQFLIHYVINSTNYNIDTHNIPLLLNKFGGNNNDIVINKASMFKVNKRIGKKVRNNHFIIKNKSININQLDLRYFKNCTFKVKLNKLNKLIAPDFKQNNNKFTSNIFKSINQTIIDDTTLLHIKQNNSTTNYYDKDYVNRMIESNQNVLINNFFVSSRLVLHNKTINELTINKSMKVINLIDCIIQSLTIEDVDQLIIVNCSIFKSNINIANEMSNLTLICTDLNPQETTINTQVINNLTLHINNNNHLENNTLSHLINNVSFDGTIKLTNFTLERFSSQNYKEAILTTCFIKQYNQAENNNTTTKDCIIYIKT